jgi:hypothetical protein
MSAILVSREGKLAATRIDCDEADYYKKCGFKSADGFKLQAVWEGVHLYARRTGKANSENKYEFPAPVDSTLFFGRCLLVYRKDGLVGDLPIPQWTALYNHLHGGFEDLGSEEESEEEVCTNLTKEGYEKDGFVVSDDELEEQEYKK